MKQTGGFAHHLSGRIIASFENPANDAGTDCCPCVFNLLGVDDDLFFELQERATDDGGMSDDNILETLKYYFRRKYEDLTNIKFDKFEIEDHLAFRNFISTIPDNYGIFCLFSRRDDIGHCVVFGKLEGEPVMLDPQRSEMITGFEELQHYIEDQTMNSITAFLMTYRDSGDYVRTFKKLMAQEELI